MIGIITYDTPHRKTQDLLAALLLNGYTGIHLAVIPFVHRQNFRPLFPHRPSRCVDLPVEELCRRLHLSFTRVKTEELDGLFEEMCFDRILIGGAGLLPAELPEKYDIINAHPGYLPDVRGLDALKWAIYNGDPVGVTTHCISAKADEGRMIDRKVVPIYREDSFLSLAGRVYETEIDMLVDSLRLLDEAAAPLTDLADSRFEANRRMAHDKERIMLERFEEVRKRAPSIEKK